MATEANRRATKKYLASQKQVRFWERPEKYEEYCQAAKDAGQSVTAYIRQATQERMERERQEKGKQED